MQWITKLARMRLVQLLPVGLAVMSSGCATHIHNHWATERDTLTRWQQAIPVLPIELHAAATAQPWSALPQVANQALDSGLPQQARVLLYVGGDTIPMDTQYCVPAPTLRALGVPHDKLDVAMALCDGRRLVVRVRREYSAAELAKQGDAAVLKSMERQLIFAVATNPSVPSMGD